MKTQQTLIDGAYKANTERLKALRREPSPPPQAPKQGYTCPATAGHSPLPNISHARGLTQYGAHPGKFEDRKFTHDYDWATKNWHRAIKAEAHAQRLADALKKAQTFIAKLEKMDVLPVNSDSGLDWDARFIIREALAQWEGGKQS